MAKSTVKRPPRRSPALAGTSAQPPAGVLERGIAILACFDADRLRLSLTELADCTGLDKATLLRLLGVLVRARMIHRFESAAYGPGPALLHLGMLYRSSFDLGMRLQPVLDAVVRQTGETAAFYIRSGDESICLYRANTASAIRHHLEVGARLGRGDGAAPAQVLLAYTGARTAPARAVRARGYVMTRAEPVPELAALAVPVFESDGGFLGTLAVVGVASRQSAAAQRRAVTIVRKELAGQGFASAATSAKTGDSGC